MPATGLLPPSWGVFEEDDEFDWETVGEGGQNYLMPAGALIITFLDNERFPGDYRNGYIDFKNFAGGVVQDLVEIAAKDDFLAIDRIRRLVKPVQSPPEKTPAEKAYWWTRYAVGWTGRE